MILRCLVFTDVIGCLFCCTFDVTRLRVLKKRKKDSAVSRPSRQYGKQTFVRKSGVDNNLPILTTFQNKNTTKNLYFPESALNFAQIKPGPVEYILEEKSAEYFQYTRKNIPKPLLTISPHSNRVKVLLLVC